MIDYFCFSHPNINYSMANSYRENYIYAGDEFSFFISKAFCSWDYGITDKSAALLKQKSIFNELQVCICVTVAIIITNIYILVLT